MIENLFVFIAVTLIVLVACLVITATSIFVDNCKTFGELLHKVFKRHSPGNNPITVYHNSCMSNCQYCGKRIKKVGRDWFVLEHVK